MRHDELFMLKPSIIQGVGIFTTMTIGKNVALQLFPQGHIIVSEVAIPFQKYCLKIGHRKWSRPPSFRSIDIGWYLNHSDNPNLEAGTYKTLRKIAKDEELTINYHNFDKLNKWNSKLQ